ncbi:TetR/AcrR family transcriptional regulator [Pseudoalteromonas sp. SSM20]|uniref:TetR/AcrR family transcriptional regulator n=1 Tax=Pseudoalteromonas sp. SSM20 TaxID=3139394 RepID=UPI003BABA323
MTKKRQLLIDTALSLFYKQGIHAIGINEILAVSGVAKRTMYSHFASKDELLKAALQIRHASFMAWLHEKLSDVNSNQQLITQLFNALASWFNHKEPSLGDFRGCFFINTSAEFSDETCEIYALCQQHKAQVRALIESKLHQSNPLLLDAICIMKEGAIVTAQVSGYHPKHLEACIKTLQDLS